MVLSAESMPLDWLFRAMGKLNCQGVWQLSRELGAASLEVFSMAVRNVLAECSARRESCQMS